MTAKQLVFIDDSGDPGFKIQKGSSPLFVIALVIFDDNLIAEEVSLAVKKLRRELKFPDDTEFKFHKSRLEVKRKFLQTISKHDFRIRAIVVKKDRIYSNFLRTSKESFFNYVVMQVLKHSSKYLNQAKLKFDKRGEKRIRNELRAYLSRELDNKHNHIFSDLKFVDSKQNVLIQTADMVASCIAAYYKGKNPELYGIIKKRIESDWEFK
ncbi:MAG: DUF3800 domain-containing protein [Candidatus Blackburnbacteria bacterium]|nr:DUF3800 domain-containing protein [Candidatus Blackburnbacteria bacterium]